MTTEVWYGPELVTLAAVRACGDNLAGYASQFNSNPFYQIPLPPTPTSYSPTGVPNDGGFYMREAQTPDTPRPIPFVEFWVDGQPTISQYTDSEASIYLVRLGIRARVSARALQVADPLNPATSTTTTAAQLAGVHNRAITLCRLAQVVTSAYLREEALVLDPLGALGICWNDISSPPSLDLGSAAPTDASGTMSADAVAFLDVYQRLYVPAGIVPIPPPTPPPSP